MRVAVINLCKKCNIDYKFIKFLLVGVINTFFAYTLYAFLLFIGFHYALATFIQVIICVCFNFFTTGKLVFKNKNNMLILKFLTLHGFMWLFGTFVLFLTNLFGYHNMYIAGIILLLPTSIISFILMKYFIFNEDKNE